MRILYVDDFLYILIIVSNNPVPVSIILNNPDNVTTHRNSLVQGAMVDAMSDEDLKLFSFCGLTVEILTSKVGRLLQ